MTAQQLVRFYPRRWRERYAEEFVETVGRKALNPQQVIDIIGGALDAWISFKSTKAKAQTEGGGEVMVQQWKAICSTNTVRYTKRDALISAGVLIGMTFVITGAGIMAGKQGHRELGDVLKGLSFPVSATLSMPFAIMKGQPRAVQTVVLGVTMAILLAAGWISTRI
jgi:hypothetical protein